MSEEKVKHEIFKVDDPEYDASLARVNAESAKFKTALRALSKNELIKMTVGLFAETIRLGSMVQKLQEVRNEKVNDSNVSAADSSVERASGSENDNSK